MTYVCKLCNKEVKLFRSHLNNTHKEINEVLYFNKYPNEVDVYNKYMIDSKKQRQECSPNSKYFYMKKGYTEEESIELLKKHNENNPFRDKSISPTSVEYWLKRGYDIQYAESQSKLYCSNSLESLTKRYGDEVAKQKHEKIMTSHKKKHKKLVENIMKREGITYEDAYFIYTERLRKMSPYSKEYWYKLGFDDIETNKNINELSKKTSPRSIEYWLLKTNGDVDLAKKYNKEFQDNISIISISKKRNCSLDDAEKIQLSYIDKMLETLYKNGHITKPDDYDSFNNYKNLVYNLTNRTYRRYKKQIDPDGLRGNDYHLDHKYSIFQGYIDNIDPNIISSVYNLEIIEASTNMSKKIKCNISKENLIKKYENRNKL